MRFLIRPRPGIEVAIGVKVAVIRGRPILCPRLQDDVDGFPIPCARVGRIDRVGPVLHAGAKRKSDFETALRHHVEHGVFFSQTVWIFQIGRCPPHADLCLLHLGDDRRCDQIRRRHHAVGGVVMFVDHDGVKADPLGEDKFSEITLVELRPLFWVVVFVWKVHPDRMIVFVVLRQMRIRHEMHEIEAHAVAHEGLPVTTH